jgi:hypothetical protein
MVTGMHQTTLGAHNHRSQTEEGKGVGSPEYLESYRIPVKLIPEMFRESGYYVTLGAGASCQKPGKTDYNFIWPKSAYDGADWRQCPRDKPFFAQVMLSGGKNRGAKSHGTDPAKVSLPPYYPDHPTLREDWADYLNAWVQIDVDVAQILSDLDEAGVIDNTVVFFWTDHGISHLRGKQFLYEEGIHVPLIVAFPDKRLAGQVRDDLVLQIDIAATSLALADINIQDHIQGKDLFDAAYQERDSVFSARDRCDETPDIIRCVRTANFKYIRNFLSHVSHMQPNQYKDGKLITQTMRYLSSNGKLDDLQNRIFSPDRPPEELYDLENDPHETVNLANNAKFKDTLSTLRQKLYEWMIESRDLGLIPEPILEDMGKQYGKKSSVLDQTKARGLTKKLITVIETAEQGDSKGLQAFLQDDNESVRYWAATGLGRNGDLTAADSLAKKISDDCAAVRIASVLALCKLGQGEKYQQVLIDEISSRNYITGMYAVRAIEISGLEGPKVTKAIKEAQNSPYEFTRRIANRMASKMVS